jgi:hypothetical protein
MQQASSSHLELFFQYYPEQVNQLMQSLSEHYLKEALGHFQKYVADTELLQERERPLPHSESLDPATSETEIDPTATTHRLDPYQRIEYIARLQEQQAQASLQKMEQVIKLMETPGDSISQQINTQWQRVRHFFGGESIPQPIALWIQVFIEREYITTKHLTTQVKELSDWIENCLRLYTTYQGNTQEPSLEAAIQDLNHSIKQYNTQEDALHQIYQRYHQISFADDNSSQSEADRFSSYPSSLTEDDFAPLFPEQSIYTQEVKAISQYTFQILHPLAEVSQDLSLPLLRLQKEQDTSPTSSIRTKDDRFHQD